MIKTTLAAALVVGAAFSGQAQASAILQPGALAATAVTDGLTLVQYREQYRDFHGRGPVVVRPGVVRPMPRPYYRRWVRRPYFGTVIGGVALGTIVAAAAVGAAPPPPAPNLCWYWADPTGTRGYWDYCQ